MMDGREDKGVGQRCPAMRTLWEGKNGNGMGIEYVFVEQEIEGIGWICTVMRTLCEGKSGNGIVQL